jgi:RNA polymerase sigma-70 factor (ECF subfamily)
VSTSSTSTAAGLSFEEAQLLERLRNRDEAAFAALVDMFSPLMLRLARQYVSSRAVAEEVVQEAWLGVLKGLDRFEGRSSLKTWVMRIVVNTALTRGGREARTVPFSALVGEDEGEPVVEAHRFRGPEDAFPGHWNAYPRDWRTLPEGTLQAKETVDVVRTAIDGLPPMQRVVILLRDVEGWPAEEVCDALELTEGNQRVLLHRARSAVRRALEGYLDG